MISDIPQKIDTPTDSVEEPAVIHNTEAQVPTQPMGGDKNQLDVASTLLGANSNEVDGFPDFPKLKMCRENEHSISEVETGNPSVAPACLDSVSSTQKISPSENDGLITEKPKAVNSRTKSEAELQTTLPRQVAGRWPSHPLLLRWATSEARLCRIPSYPFPSSLPHL